MKQISGFLRDMLLVGLLGFGGGTALIPLLENKDKKFGDDTEGFSFDVAIASVTPGALPVEIASGIGRRNFGRLPMVLAANAVALPGVILCLLCYLGIQSMPDEWLEGYKLVVKLVSAYIIFLLIRYIVRSLIKIKGRSRWIYAAIALVVAGLRFLKVDAGLLMAVAFVTAIVKNRKDIRNVSFSSEKIKEYLKDMGSWLVFLTVLVVPALLVSKNAVLELIGRGGISVFLSYGGGDAYLSVASTMFVDSGLIEQSCFYETIVNVVNLIPGSILCKCLSSIAYFSGCQTAGIGMGLTYMCALYGVSVSFSCMIFHSVGALTRSFGRGRCMMDINLYVRPVVTGLLLQVIYKMLCVLVG